jgi:hypothetical protein
MWRVADLPHDSSITTLVDWAGMVSVVVPPDGVKTWLTTGETVTGMVVTVPYESMTATGDGVPTKLVAGT